MIVHIEKHEGVHTVFQAPPSKSMTHRAFILGSLAMGNSLIRQPLHSEDTTVTRRILMDWGVHFADTMEGMEIRGTTGVFHCSPESRIDVQDSGTSMRFCTSLALLCHAPVIMDGSPRMQERPIGPLVDALNALGGEISYLGRKGYPPLHIAGMLRGGEAEISGKESSQYISSLLLTAPYSAEDVTIRCKNMPVSRSYIDITLSIMEQFGAVCEREDYLFYYIRAGVPYQGRTYTIEGDFSSGAYFMAIPAICGGSVLVKGLDSSSTQGDRIFLDILSSMGCTVRWKKEGVEVSREGTLQGVQVNMSSAPDSVQTVCVVAAVAQSPTTISGVAHLRLKESDRLKAIVKVLRLFGAGAKVTDDSITIFPAPLHGCVVDPGNDHRTAMSAAILGLGVGGVTILQAECVNKSFPEFWSQLQKAGLW
jgi:3-phosphoshikimate 1-carboxyvinyltransferase